MYLQQGANDLHMVHCHAIISWYIKIQNGLTFMMPAYPDCHGKEPVEFMSVCLSVQEVRFHDSLL